MIFHYKTLFLIIISLFIWFTQPAFSLKETQHNKSTDKYSILYILLASGLSMIFSVTEWAYFTNQSANIIMSIIGVIMIIGGLILRTWAIKTLDRFFTATVRIKQEQHLIKQGPYAIVKHPAYTGAFFSITGVPVFLNDNVSIYISALLLGIAYYIRIGEEEKVLLNYFGNEYREYSKHVKKFLPFIW
ncbi:MAG: isoprenylcysteine carboxylmethyltransferase family protein [Parafilimonas sp.]